MELALQGWTYQSIADELGYANRGTVYRIVQQTLQKHEIDSVQFLLALELARLDRLFSTFFEQGVAGDVKSAELALKIIIHRSKLLRLESRRDDEVQGQNNIVVTGSKEEFIEALQAGQRGSH